MDWASVPTGVQWRASFLKGYEAVTGNPAVSDNMAVDGV